jgi:hypothetical protein
MEECNKKILQKRITDFSNAFPKLGKGINFEETDSYYSGVKLKMRLRNHISSAGL